MKDKYRVAETELDKAVAHIELLGEVFEGGQHISDVIKDTSIKGVYGNGRLKIMLNDKIDRLNQITARVRDANDSEDFRIELKNILNFTYQQNQVFTSLFQMMVEHFASDVPYQLKNDPQSVDKLNQKFLNMFKDGLNKVHKVNQRSRDTLEQLTKIWNQGLRELDKNSELKGIADPEVLLSSHSKVMNEIF